MKFLDKINIDKLLQLEFFRYLFDYPENKKVLKSKSLLPPQEYFHVDIINYLPIKLQANVKINIDNPHCGIILEKENDYLKREAIEKVYSILFEEMKKANIIELDITEDEYYPNLINYNARVTVCKRK